MTRTTTAALAWTRERGPIPDKAGRAVGATGWCKRETRLAYAVESDGSATAAESWARNPEKHTDGSTPPRGAILYWTGGSEGEGHAAITEDDRGRIRTVDLPVGGRWGTMSSRADLERHFSKLRYAGWSPYIDGVRVIPTPKPKPKPVPASRLAKLRGRLLAIANDPKVGRVRRARARAAAAVLKGLS